MVGRRWILIAGIGLVVLGILGMALVAGASMMGGAWDLGGGIGERCPGCGRLFDRWGSEDAEDLDTGPDGLFEGDEPRSEATRTPGGGERGRGAPLYGESGSDGESIFLYGATDQRSVPFGGGPRWFARMGGGCATCHGADAGGGAVQMMGERVRAPDIRYEVLTSGTGADAEVWTDEDIKEAVINGREPDGGGLRRGMPRWRMTDGEFDALLGYMKEMNKT